RFLGYRFSFFGERELMNLFVEWGIIRRLPRQRTSKEEKPRTFDRFRFFFKWGIIRRLPLPRSDNVGGSTRHLKDEKPRTFDKFTYFFYLNAKALSTNWISYEIDKVVSTLYFLIVLIAIFIALNSEAYFNNLLQILNYYSNQTSNSINNLGHALNATKNRISNS